MAEEQKSSEKKSAFVEDETVNKMNRTLRKDAVMDESKIMGGKDSGKIHEYNFDSSQRIIKGKDFRMDEKPFIVGGTIDSDSKEPEVEVIKDAEGNVVKIRLKCICGRETDIDCVY